jgi:hypothetical protein
MREVPKRVKVYLALGYAALCLSLLVGGMLQYGMACHP